MNLPWYGWSRWTCFVRSRSGSSASDHERSRSSVAYSSSCVTATRRDSTLASERLRHALHAAVAHGDHVEADREPGEAGTRAEPRLCSAAQPPLFLGRDHLERVAEPRALLLLDFDETKSPPAPDDQVELVAAAQTFSPRIFQPRSRYHHTALRSAAKPEPALGNCLLVAERLEAEPVHRR